jgi:hypothetical protein
VGRYDEDTGVAAATGHHLGRPGDRLPPLPDRDEAADQGAHHVVAERVGAHRPDDEPGLVTPPRQLEQGAHGGRALALLAEGGEVLQADERGRRLVHRRHVERARPRQDVAAHERVGQLAGVDDAVGVPPPDRREAGVEAPGGRAHPAYAQVGGQDAVDPAGERLQRRVRRASGRRGDGVLVHVDVRHLPPGVDSGVRPARHGHPHPGDPQRRRQGLLERALHGAQPGLGGPPREVGAVVGTVDPQAHAAILGPPGGTPHTCVERLSGTPFLA